MLGTSSGRRHPIEKVLSKAATEGYPLHIEQINSALRNLLFAFYSAFTADQL
jgi:hypothetical protein